MPHRGLRIISSIAFVVSLLFLVAEVFTFWKIIHAQQYVYNYPLPAGAEDDNQGSVLVIVGLVLFIVWSLINVLLGGIVFYFRRKKNFPLALSIIQIVLFSPKIFFLLYFLYVEMVIHSSLH
jgi:hypothetical protein